jgi:hypothetical protein
VYSSCWFKVSKEAKPLSQHSRWRAAESSFLPFALILACALCPRSQPSLILVNHGPCQLRCYILLLTNPLASHQHHPARQQILTHYDNLLPIHFSSHVCHHNSLPANNQNSRSITYMSSLDRLRPTGCYANKTSTLTRPPSNGADTPTSTTVQRSARVSSFSFFFRSHCRYHV